MGKTSSSTKKIEEVILCFELFHNLVMLLFIYIFKFEYNVLVNNTNL